jgi:hypothetical protein
MTIKRLFAILLGVALFAMAVRETIDPDLWWHLRTGEAILQHGIPQTDIFSYTVPDHEWVVQQWLTDVVMWLVYRVGGAAGLIVVFAGLVTATFLLVYKRCAGRPYLAAFTVLLGLLTAALPLGVRPQMVNIFFLALFLFILEGYREGKIRRKRLYLLPLITLLWANMHSGFMVGVAVLALYTVGEALGLMAKRQFGHPTARFFSWPDVGLLAGLSLSSFLAAFVNPSTYKLVFFSLGTLGSNAIQSNILEWRSPDFHQVYFWFFGMTLVLGVLAWVFSPRRPTPTEMLLFLGTAVGGLISARHIPLFAVVAPIILSRHLLLALDGTAVYRIVSSEDKVEIGPTGAARILNWVILVVVVGVTGLWTAVRIGNNYLSVEKTFPVAAVDFLEESGLDETRIYNHYEWGGYLIWRRIPVFIDGRTELYGNEFFLAYLQAFEARGNWQRTLDSYDVETVIMPRNSALSTVLTASVDWKELYVDEQARIFGRQQGPVP